MKSLTEHIGIMKTSFNEWNKTRNTANNDNGSDV